VICVLLSWVGTKLLVSFLNCYSAVSVEGREFILTGISSSWRSADSVEVVDRSCGGLFLVRAVLLGLPAISGGAGWLLSVWRSVR
jgi:hypothetical protein